MSENDRQSAATERDDCPYCDDGELEQIKDWDNPKACTNGGCPAGFVVVL